MASAGAALLAAVAGACPAPALAETLNESLSSAYRYNPQLDAERARLRATDEEVARARSGYRPVITGNADVNWLHTNLRPDNLLTEGTVYPKGYSVDLVQPIFTGFQTYNAVNESEALVRTGRETLRGVEQDVLLDAVTAYMDVVQQQAVVRERENNVNVLSRELKATEDRFSVGEVTRTDVAQSLARRAQAASDLDRARADLKTFRGTFERVVGHAPTNLVEPSGYERLLPRSLEEAIAIGTRENPAVVGALYREQGARFAVDRIRGELLPQVQLEAIYENRFDTVLGGNEVEVGSVTGRLSVPIYEGGEVYARVRQAKQIHVSRLQEIEQFRSQTEEQIVAAWSQLLGARARVESDKVQVQANETALTGVREEERVGQRTVLDVLDAERELVNSQVTLAISRRDVVVASYSLIAAIGRLDVLNTGVTETVYDDEAHYQEVRRKWFGLSITHADGREEHLDVSQSQAEQAPVK